MDLEALGLTRNVLFVIGGAFLALVVGSLIRISHLHALPPETAKSLRLRLRTWWLIAITLTVVVLLRRPAVVLFCGLVSVLGMREYLRLISHRAVHGHVIAWAYACIPFQYLWIYLGWYEMFLVFIPVVAFLLITMRVVLMREPEVFLPAVGALHWGVMMLVFCFSHVAYLLALPVERNPAGGMIGLFLYLVVLTEFNDIAQALWGRPLGKHAVIPRISPGKSWEGLVGGVACTTVLAILLAPLLTPLVEAPSRWPAMETTWPRLLSPWALFAGVAIGVSGFFGDITISAVKRYSHVKDSGTMLPGQGGILDRIDSLTFTAPVFFHYVHWLYY